MRWASEMREWGARVKFGRMWCLWKASDAVMEGAETQGRFLLKPRHFLFLLSFLRWQYKIIKHRRHLWVTSSWQLSGLYALYSDFSSVSLTDIYYSLHNTELTHVELYFALLAWRKGKSKIILQFLVCPYITFPPGKQGRLVLLTMTSMIHL